MNALKIDSFAASDRGYVRKNNEDAWHIALEERLFIVADGVGGHNAGEVAAALTVDSLLQASQRFKKEATIEESCQFLRRAIADANTCVFKAAHAHPEYAGMGTTLSCFLIRSDHLIYAHVGDSRLYRYRNGLKQLTEDHSILSRPTPTQKSRYKITRAIGAQPFVYPDIGVLTLSSEDLYLLCSDGLSDYVDSKKISLLLTSSPSLEKTGRKLIEAALENGGNDNITLLLVKVMMNEKSLFG